MFPPMCPIRETYASILRKKNPVDCRWHDRTAAPFVDYCMPGQKFHFVDPMKQRLKFVNHVRFPLSKMYGLSVENFIVFVFVLKLV